MRKIIIGATMLLSLSNIAGCDENTGGSKSCGDNVLDIGEECDSEQLNNESCSTQGFHSGELLCGDDCTFNLSLCQANGWCGDGALQPEYEDCEGDVGEADCASEGYLSGTLTCGSDCLYDFSQCLGSETCGDGIVQAHESCDGTNLNGHDCSTEGFNGIGGLLCSDTCRFNTEICATFGVCGDSLVQEDWEECDTTVSSFACSELGYISGQVDACSDSCMFDRSDCFSCGDNILHTELGETCDGSAFVTQCADMGLWGLPTCDANCTTGGLDRCNNTLIYGTGTNDEMVDMLLVGDNIYLLMSTPNGSSEDIRVIKLDVRGYLLWERQLETEANWMKAAALAVRSDNGNLVVAGTVNHWDPVALLNATTIGGFDGFVAEITPDGVWTEGWVIGSAGDEFLEHIACVDGGTGTSECVVSGYTNDAGFISTGNGGEDWFVYNLQQDYGVRGGGSENDRASFVIPRVGGTADRYIIIGTTNSDGYLGANNGANDLFIAAIDGTNAAVMSSLRLPGTGTETPRRLTIDDVGTVIQFYLTLTTDGSMDGTPNLGNKDAVVAKCGITSGYSTITCSTYQFGADTEDLPATVINLGNGTIVVTGCTYQRNIDPAGFYYGGYDPWVVTLSNSLTNYVVVDQFGTNLNEYVSAGALTADGTLILGGHAERGFEDDFSFGGYDLFLYRGFTLP